MADELKDQRIPIMMTPSEVKAIDDWMFGNRLRSRGEAIRRLCQVGLALDEQMPKINGVVRKSNSGTAQMIDKINSMLESGNNSNVAKLNLAIEWCNQLLSDKEALMPILSDLFDISFAYKNISFEKAESGFFDKETIRAAMKLMREEGLKSNTDGKSASNAE